MTAVITANNRLARDNVAPPPQTKEDGSNYNWRMFYDNRRRIADADTPAEMLDVLVPGYSDLKTFEEKYTARYLLARRVQMLARATVLDNISEESYNSLTASERKVLEWDTDSDPAGWGDGTKEPIPTTVLHRLFEQGVPEESDLYDIDEWNSDHPLVLLDTSYAPYTEVPRPSSKHGDFEKNLPNLMWLSPADELELLKSLSAIGYIDFGRPAAIPRAQKTDK